MMESKHNGQTLIEILVAVGIIAVSLTVMVSVTTAAVARNREAKERAIATRLTQEAIEWIRGERDMSDSGWVGFEADMNTMDVVNTTVGILTLCLNSSPINYTVPTVPNPDVVCPGYGLPLSRANYKREMVANLTVTGQIPITVTTSWIAGNRTDSVSAQSLLKDRF